MAWTDDRVEKLRELWDKGLSASQIAKELAEGVTRNAVIGKAHRMGLASRPSPVKADPAKRAAATAKKKAAPTNKKEKVKSTPSIAGTAIPTVSKSKLTVHPVPPGAEIYTTIPSLLVDSSFTIAVFERKATNLSESFK